MSIGSRISNLFSGGSRSDGGDNRSSAPVRSTTASPTSTSAHQLGIVGRDYDIPMDSRASVAAAPPGQVEEREGRPPFLHVCPHRSSDKWSIG